MAKASSYKIAFYDGGLPGRPDPMRAGLLQLSDTEWRVLFRDAKPGVVCGLRRSTVTCDDLGYGLCRVTISDAIEESFTTVLTIEADSGTFERDLEHRRNELDLSMRRVDAVRKGAWWLDDAAFRPFGWSRTCSLAGIWYVSGWWGPGEVRRSRLPRVLDLGPDGVSLRGWRSGPTLPWDEIAAIEIGSGDGGEKNAGGTVPTSLSIHSRVGSVAILRTSLASQDELAEWLSPIMSRLGAEVTAAP